jgi:2,3-bisphosphoglycerate-independent phosphoglycerate mutase
MKFVMVVLSGVADLPHQSLQGKTPLAVARTPTLDRLASAGRIGQVQVSPGDRPPGSDVALLRLFGFDPVEFPLRRGPIEAIGAGIEFGPDDLVLRGNLVSLYNETIQDLTGGRIQDGEAQVLLRAVADEVGDDGLVFQHLRGYRFLLVVRGGAAMRISTVPPHAAFGRPVRECYPAGEDALRLERVLDRSRRVLADHEINRVKVDLGENPANFLWLWGAGSSVELPSFESVFQMTGATIAGAALARGIGESLRMHTPVIEGATGDLDTDLAAKANAAIAALDAHDFVFVHVQAANEASHLRDAKLKVNCIQDTDRLLLTPLADRLSEFSKWRLLVACDHVTATGKDEASTAKAPFLIAGSDLSSVRSWPFDEEHAAQSDLQVDEPANLMEYFLGFRPKFPR